MIWYKEISMIWYKEISLYNSLISMTPIILRSFLVSEYIYFREVWFDVIFTESYERMMGSVKWIFVGHVILVLNSSLLQGCDASCWFWCNNILHGILWYTILKHTHTCYFKQVSHISTTETISIHIRKSLRGDYITALIEPRIAQLFNNENEIRWTSAIKINNSSARYVHQSTNTVISRSKQPYIYNILDTEI